MLSSASCEIIDFDLGVHIEMSMQGSPFGQDRSSSCKRIKTQFSLASWKQRFLVVFWTDFGVVSRNVCRILLHGGLDNRCRGPRELGPRELPAAGRNGRVHRPQRYALDRAVLTSRR